MKHIAEIATELVGCYEGKEGAYMRVAFQLMPQPHYSCIKDAQFWARITGVKKCKLIGAIS